MALTTITHNPDPTKELVNERKAGAPARPEPLPLPSRRRYEVAWLGVPLILFSLLAIGACGGGLSEAEKRYNEGLDAQNAGRLEEAVSLYTESIELDPNLIDAYVNRSLAYSLLGRYEEAVKDATQAIELDPKDAGAYSIRSDAYVGLDRLDEAVADANKAIELDPELADAYVSRSQAYRLLDRFDRAVEDASKAIELDPTLVDAYLWRALAYGGLDRLDEAVADASKAIELDPELVEAYKFRSLMHALLERYDEAVADANKAIELDPEDPEAYHNRSLAYEALSREAEAERDLVKACDLGLEEACESLAAAPTREEALDILPQVALQLEDLPAGFGLLDSRFDSLTDEAQFSDDPDRHSRELESWGFLLGHDRYYERIASEGLLEVDVEAWLHEDEEGANDAFLDGALFVVYGEVTPEEIRDFPALGDESEGYRLSGPYVNSNGDEIQAEGYSVIIRVEQFLAAFTTASRAGQASQEEAAALATALESRMESQAR